MRAVLQTFKLLTIFHQSSTKLSIITTDTEYVYVDIEVVSHCLQIYFLQSRNVHRSLHVTESHFQSEPKRTLRKHLYTNTLITFVVYQLDMGIPAMTKCCNQLDVCYDTCGSNKYRCDSKFRWCLHSICSDLKKSLGFVSKVEGWYF